MGVSAPPKPQKSTVSKSPNHRLKKSDKSDNRTPRSVSDLSPAPYNPRKITEEKLAYMGKSMEEFGDLSGIVFNVRTGNLVGGHQRRKKLDPTWKIEKRGFNDPTGTIAVGWVKGSRGLWNYREVDWPLRKEKAANIAANGHRGEFIDDDLDQLLVELDDGELDLGLLGFEAAELEKRIGGGGGEVEGTVKFSEELGESNNYVVLFFRNETDWLQALTLFDLDSVYSRRRNGEPWAKGVGRVLSGPEAIEKLLAAKV